MNSNIYTEVGYKQAHKYGNDVCGDVILTRKVKEENRTIVVLSDGLGSGIKANVLANMTASMTMNFTTLNEPVQRTADIIIQTLPVDKKRKISFASFSTADVDSNGKVRLLEYGNPKAILIKHGILCELDRRKLSILGINNVHQTLYESEFIAAEGDRLLMFSDGVSQSGIGRQDMPFGWEREEIYQYLQYLIRQNPGMSASEMASKVVNRSIGNDIFKAQDDITCSSIYFREPRKMLICTGPPYNHENDLLLADKVKSFEGTRVVCGGTTAQIISRLLNEEIEVDMLSGRMGLPPIGTMEGVNLVTEGILTIGRVEVLLEEMQQGDDLEDSPAGDILKLIREHDSIEFLVGTRVNEAHQDPSLPVELEIRRNVVKRIARLLEEKFLKKVKISFL